MAWDVTVHLIPFLITIVASVVLLLYILRRAESSGAQYIGWMLIGQLGWSLVYIVSLTTEYRELVIISDHFLMMFVPLPTIGWILFALEYAGYGDWHRRKVLAAIFCVPIVTWLLVPTNPLHKLFWSGYAVHYDATGLVLPQSPMGFWFVIHVLHVYVLQFVGIALVIRRTLRSWSIYRMQTITLISAALFPLIPNVLLLMGTISIDYTSAANGATAIAIMGGVYRYELFDLAPVARDTVLEEMRDAVIVMDHKSRIIDVNDAATNLLAPENEIVGGSASEVLPFDLFEADGGLTPQIKEPADTDQELALSDEGRQAHYRLNSTPMTGKDGERMGTILVLQDITELKRREHELEQANRELEQSNEELEILNRIVRHDIQNDMNVVKGHAEVVKAKLDEEDADAIEPVLHNTQHAIELTEAVRDLIEAATGEDDLDLERVDLLPLLEQELEKARVAHSETEFGLEFLEDHQYGLQVWANGMLSSVITNLLSNAVRHNDTGTPAVTIDVDTEPETVTLRVADNGPGVPDGKKDDIFGRGEKGLESPGTGIGLYLVDTLVDEYGGSVHVEDNEPRGAVFVITLDRVTG